MTCCLVQWRLRRAGGREGRAQGRREGGRFQQEFLLVGVPESTRTDLGDDVTGGRVITRGTPDSHTCGPARIPLLLQFTSRGFKCGSPIRNIYGEIHESVEGRKGHFSTNCKRVYQSNFFRQAMLSVGRSINFYL